MTSRMAAASSAVTNAGSPHDASRSDWSSCSGVRVAAIGSTLDSSCDRGTTTCEAPARFRRGGARRSVGSACGVHRGAGLEQQHRRLGDRLMRATARNHVDVVRPGASRRPPRELALASHESDGSPSCQFHEAPWVSGGDRRRDQHVRVDDDAAHVSHGRPPCGSAARFADRAQFLVGEPQGVILVEGVARLAVTSPEVGQ